MNNASISPTIIIAHPTKAYDRQLSAKWGIERTLYKCRPAAALQIDDGLNKPYINLHPVQRAQDIVSGSGVLLYEDFFKSKSPWFKTDTFVFVGGRALRCIRNAFLSIFLYKLYKPKSLLSNPNDLFIKITRRNPQDLENLFNSLSPRSAAGHLNFHFNFEGIYPLLSDFEWFSKNQSEVYWSGNMIYIMMAATVSQNRRLLANSGWNIREFVEGVPSNAFISESTRENKRTVNLWYWANTASMAKALNERTAS